MPTTTETKEMTMATTKRKAKAAPADLAGTCIRTVSEFGAVAKGAAAEASKFAVAVRPGTEGTVTGPHPSKGLHDWWLVAVEVDGIAYDMPLTRYQVEVCADNRKLMTE